MNVFLLSGSVVRVWRSSRLFIPLKYLYGWCLGKAIAVSLEVQQMSGDRVPQSFQKCFLSKLHFSIRRGEMPEGMSFRSLRCCKSLRDIFFQKPFPLSHHSRWYWSCCSGYQKLSVYLDTAKWHFYKHRLSIGACMCKK